MRFGRSYVQLGLIRPVNTLSGDAAPSDSDTGASTETQSLVVNISSSDTSSSTETQIASVPVSSSDTGSGTETQSIVATFSRSDTASGADSGNVDTSGNPFQTDNSSGSETWSISATFNRTETSTGAETQIIGPRVSDTGLLSSETFTIAATRSGSDTVSGLDSASVGGINNPFQADSVSSLETWDVEEVSNWSPPVSGITFYPEEDIALVLGPANIYIAEFGTLEPSDFSALPGTWRDLGGILGGVSLAVNNTYEGLKVIQETQTPGSRLKKRELSVETQIAEPALINMLYASNDGTVTTGSGWSSYTPSLIDQATPLTYRIIVIDGWTPQFHGNGQHKRRRIILRRCLSTEGLKMSYHKEKQTTASVRWDVHRVDAVTAPFKIIDEV